MLDFSKSNSIGKGPFGLRMGMSISDLNLDFSEIAPFKYHSMSVPKPHTAFESYVLAVTPSHGLSWIKGIGKTIQTSPYGIEIKTEFESMRSRLEKKYGKYESFDFLMMDSIWSEPRDWMQALHSRERVLMSQWNLKSGSILDNNLLSVALIASASDIYTGYVSVEYSFSNYKDAELEISDLEDDAL